MLHRHFTICNTEVYAYVSGNRANVITQYLIDISRLVYIEMIYNSDKEIHISSIHLKPSTEVLMKQAIVGLFDSRSQTQLIG